MSVGAYYSLSIFILGNQIHLPFFFSFLFFSQLILSKYPFLSSLRFDLGNGTLLIGLNCYFFSNLVVFSLLKKLGQLRNVHNFGVALAGYLENKNFL